MNNELIARLELAKRNISDTRALCYDGDQERDMETLGQAIAALSTTASHAGDAKTLDALKKTTSALAAAISLLKAGGRKAVGSDKMFEQMLADYSAARSQGCNVLYGQDALSTTTSHAGDDVAVLPVAEVSGLDLWIEENAETPPLSLNDWYVPVKGLKQFMDRQQRSAPVSEAVAGAVSEDDLNRIIIAALAATNSKRLWSLTHESGPYSINVVNHDTTRLFREFLRLIPADSEQVEGDARFEQLMRTLKNCAYDDGKQNRSANSKWTDAAEESFRAYVKQSRQAEAAQSALSQNKAGDV